MLRSAFILALCLLLMAGGLWGLLGDYPPAVAARLAPLGPRAAALLLACGALLTGAFAVLTLLSISRLVRRLEGPGKSGTLGGMHVPRGALRSLSRSVNALLDRARQAQAQAELQVKQLELQLKVIGAERQHLEGVIQSISDAVLVTDPFDELVLANESAARAFAFDLGTATRAPIQQVLKDPHVISLIREMRLSNSRGGRRVVEHCRPGPDGERTYKVTLACVSGQAGGAPGVVAVLQDMTWEKEVARMKSDFVSSVSHELRTPLASIKAYAEMLIDGEAADERTAREFYEVIHNEANRLGRLIDNLLNISRIESGLARISKQPRSLTVLLKEALEVIAPQARQKRIDIREEISPAFYQTLIDRDMIYEAALNLLSNAVKYTPEGGTVSVRTEVDESANTVRVRISDSGVGIPPKDLPFIFDKFYRSDANSRMAKGTGLGLSLVKHIVEAVHHGRLFVESRVGEGSTFGFDLELVN